MNVQQCEYELKFEKGATMAVIQPQRPTRLDLIICGRRLLKAALIQPEAEPLPFDWIGSIRVGCEEQIATPGAKLPVDLFRTAGGVPITFSTMSPGTLFTIELAAPASREFYLTVLGREALQPTPEPRSSEERKPGDSE